MRSNSKEGMALALMSKLRANTKVLFLVLGIILVLVTVAGSFAAISSGNKAPSKYVAEVNGIKLEREEFERNFFFEWQNQNQMNYGQLTGMDQEPMKTQYLVNMLLNEALLDEAKKLKLDATKEEVAEELKKVEESVGGADELQARLEMVGVSIDTLNRDIKNSLIFQKLAEHLTKDITIADDDVRTQLEEVKASHILVEDEETAKDLYAQLQNGADFAKLAKENSTDPGSKDEGGELGFFTRGSMVAEFETAAFALKPGEISEPVKSQFGWHIIKVEDKKSPTDAEFEEKKATASEELLNKKKTERLIAYQNEVKGKAKIKIFDPQLKARYELNEGKIEEAIKSYNEAIKSKPSDPYLYASLSEAYHRKGDLDKAWENILEASAKSNDAAIKMNLAMLGQVKMQNIVNAKETEEEKSSQEWANEDENIKAIYDDVIKALDEAAATNEGDLWSHLQIAQMYNSFGEKEKGQAEMDKVKALAEKLQQQSGEEQDNETTEEQPAE